MSQEELAEKVGLAIRTIYTAENGIQSLRTENIAKICSVLYIGADYLIWSKLGVQESAEFQRIFSKFTPDQVAILKRFIQDWRNS